MAALSDERKTQTRNPGAIFSLPCAVDIIYAGSIVMINNAGYAAPAAAEASNTQGCVGIAMETVDNSAGSAGDKRVKVQECEALVAGTTLAQTAVGNVVYAEDDQTVDETQGTNEPRAGIVTEFVSASSAWVLIRFGLSNSD